MLDEHIANIAEQLEPARAHVAFLEREMADARKARDAIESQTASAAVAQNVDRVLRVHAFRRFQHFGSGNDAPKPAPSVSPYRKLTMKQLVRKALDEHFVNGATATELLEFFRNAWGRNDVVRTSLSPQLSRLKGEGLIVLQGKHWMLASQSEASDDHNENEAPAALPLDASEGGRRGVRGAPLAFGYHQSRPQGAGESE